jgi:hypothetical protein
MNNILVTKGNTYWSGMRRDKNASSTIGSKLNEISEYVKWDKIESRLKKIRRLGARGVIITV